MKIIQCVQGSPEWHKARLGVPTASHFASIITPKTRKPSASAEKYAHELVGGWLTGIPADAVETAYMARGTALEAQAVAYYELQRDVTTAKVGFCLRDDESAGCSPDRLVGDDGGLEIKCPSAHVQIANILNMTDEHFTQIQGCMYVTGRKWWDLLSYHPDLPPALVRFTRDEEYMTALEPALAAFGVRLAAMKQHFLDMGCVPAGALAPEFAASLTPRTEEDEV